jgi:DNA mismatch endonuclease (patch repair protein)
MGLRFRVDRAIGPGGRRRVDIVLPKARVAVFVDGCFWHSCPDHGSRPKTNRDWWAQKLDGNVSRDRETDRDLAGAGWVVVRVWEHEDAAVAAARIASLVVARKE